MNEDIAKKWNEWPFSFPPVNTLALVEFDTARDEWCRCYIVSHGMDECGCYCQFQWLEGPKTNKTMYHYTPESFKPLLPVENKQEKSLDNLLKELHNLKQEGKELSTKVDNILKEINSVVGLYGLSVLFTNEYDMLQEND